MGLLTIEPGSGSSNAHYVMTSVARAAGAEERRLLVGPAEFATAPWSALLYAGVLGLALWAPLPFGSTEPWAVGILRLVVFVLVALWALGALVQGRLVLASSPIQLVIPAAIVYGIVQLIPMGEDARPLTSDPFSTRQALLTLGAYGCFFSVALVSIDTERKLRIAALSCFWLGFVLSIVAVLQYVSGTSSIYWIRDASKITPAFFGPFVNKNHFAGLLALWLPLGVGMLVSGAVPREKRVLTAFACIVSLVAVALSRSRAGLVCVVAGVLAAGVFAAIGSLRASTGVSRGRAIAGALALAILLAAATFAGVRWVGAEPIVAGFSKLPAEVTTSDAVSRPGIWADTWQMVEERPVFGHGLGAFAVAFTQYGRSTGTVLVLAAHNDFLQLLAETGAVGGILGAAFLVMLAGSGWSALGRRPVAIRGVGMGAAAGCLALLLHEIVDFNLQIPSNALAFLFLAALVVRAARIPATSQCGREAHQ